MFSGGRKNARLVVMIALTVTCELEAGMWVVSLK